MNSYENGVEWKPIKGFEEYKVSTNGVVLGKRGKPLSPFTSRGGYKMVSLKKDGKLQNQLVHRLVAITFIENPNNYECVNHIDENKNNNSVENLEWCTRDYNNSYGTINIRRSITHRKLKIDHTQKNKKTYIRCIETGEIHYLNEWERMGVHNTKLVCLGKIKHARGLHYEYVKGMGKL